jgi:hypothetical protein
MAANFACHFAQRSYQAFNLSLRLETAGGGATSITKAGDELQEDDSMKEGGVREK